jgi:hypothetical protein
MGTRKNQQKKAFEPHLPPDHCHRLEAFNRRLALVDARVEGVVKGHSVGCYIHGDGGLGKSFAVTQTLKQHGVPFQLTNGRITGRGLIDQLDKYPDEIHVLDDVEPLFNDKNAIGVLRAACWKTDEGTQGRSERLITWRVYRSAIEVYFTGGIIAIGNSLPAKNPEVMAMLTRIPCIEIRANDLEIAAKMREIALAGDQSELAIEERWEIVEFVIAEAMRLGQPLDLRMIKNAYSDYIQYQEGDSGLHWHDLVSSRLRKRAGSLGAVECLGKREAMKLREQEILRGLVDLPKAERLVQWKAQTGKGQASMYRRLDELSRADLALLGE